MVKKSKGKKACRAKSKKPQGITMKGLEKDLKKFWNGTKFYLKKVADESQGLLKKGEDQFRNVSEKSRIGLQVLILSSKVERLYYDLGKLAAKKGKAAQKRTSNMRKKIMAMEEEIELRKKRSKKL